jgi:hypothetical protein
MVASIYSELDQETKGKSYIRQATFSKPNTDDEKRGQVGGNWRARRSDSNSNQILAST